MADMTARTDQVSAPAARLGAELQSARKQLGWELPQLAASLRIRQAYLEAIEGGRVGDLPGSTYALGFVRAYATALGLQGEDVARRFRAEALDVHGKPALRFPAPVPQRGVPAGALMLLGLVILGGAYGGWYWMTAHRATLVETVPPIPERFAPSVPQAAPSPQVATILPATAPPSPGTVPSVAPGAAAPAAHTGAPDANATKTAPSSSQVMAQPAAAGAGNPPTATTPPPATVTAAASSPANPPGATPPAAPVPAGTRIVLKASADAWVTVKQKGGPPLLNKTMHAGDTWPVPADKPGLTLTTGNAGGTSIDVDGAPIPVSLGTSGMVRRDLPLDADMLKAGKLPPAPARKNPTAATAAAPKAVVTP